MRMCGTDTALTFCRYCILTQAESPRTWQRDERMGFHFADDFFVARERHKRATMTNTTPPTSEKSSSS